MVDRIYSAQLQLNKANSSDTKAPFFGFKFIMVQFPIKFMINGTVLILIQLKSHFIFIISFVLIVL